MPSPLHAPLSDYTVACFHPLITSCNPIQPHPVLRPPARARRRRRQACPLHRRRAARRRSAWALGLTLLFAVVEVVAGFMANSLALISDAGHMVTDAAALGLALLAQLIAKPPAFGAPLVRLGARRSAGRLRQLPGDAGPGRLDRARSGAAPRQSRAGAGRDGASWWPRSAWRSTWWWPGCCRATSTAEHPRGAGARDGRPARLGRRDRRRRRHLLYRLDADRPAAVDARVRC